MIDTDGFRPNVGIVLANNQSQVLWARRIGGQNAWQFPQGGICRGESPEDALFRELEEEVGLKACDVDVLSVTRGWLRYSLPKRMVRNSNAPICLGQKQKWFLLRLTSCESSVELQTGDKPEFDDWCWVSYWYPLNKVVSFKKEVYRRAMKELAPAFNNIHSVYAHSEDN
ncbi:MAG: RNA pyrophosphohydrolase [Cellvibrionaceae bacterium]|nr:RNA pyrophosphohydrolase [Cellvibrionaceae bacterium]